MDNNLKAACKESFDIACMLLKCKPEQLTYVFVQRIIAINDLLVNSYGGALRSRQVIASIIVDIEATAGTRTCVAIMDQADYTKEFYE